MINLKKYMKMIFIIIIFSLIVFTFSIVSSILISDYKMNVEINNAQNIDTSYLQFDDSNKVSFNDVINILNDYQKSKIYMEYDPIPKYISNNTLFGKGIYCNYNINNNIPILEGRDFTLKEMNSNDRKVLVGNKLRSYIVKENDKNYFTIGKEKFEVIGILGSIERETGYDYTFIINLKSSDDFSDLRARWRLNVSDENDLKSILNNYKDLAIEHGMNVNISNENYSKVNLIDIFGIHPEFTGVFIMVFGFGLINLIIVVYYWMNKNIKEIGIRKAYGGNDFKISLHIIVQYEIGVIISVIVGILAHLCLKPILIVMFPMFTFKLYYENIIFATVFFMIIGVIVAIIPLIKAKKVQPVTIMKGNLK
ncbi:ABC transporter permease [Clostridium septicum]|uniref:FtsX-like permease family protein n=2 Tax=Clostridium septicum TaxID=1504 RepID=A0A9N7JJG1_CLOSE|nr:FtsX-like permease family protein [Clostridium septicum]AYE33633.1 hypothetical protein CP523_03695 [Clostridium septicum]MDU1312821.1 FtsX-like permease family protein [Clostridium septicum]QAS61797.1 ABC transporter permease [Clostridium septicum]UEC21754.1 FtsX-like permease family protein [Clostridium septicum]USS00193.1 FtsX-like permease family protein [Clostridium septicum]